MRSTSAAFDEAVARNTRVLLKATLGLADGTVLELTGADFVMGGLNVTQSSSSSGSFDIGAAIVGTCDATLANYDGKFDPYDFTGATLVPYVGKELDGGRVEWLRMGTFNAEQPDSYGSTIKLKCRDNLTLMDVPYSKASTSYPATLRTIASDACLACSLTLSSVDFPHASYVVSTRPDTQNLTCLKVLGYVAQVAGCFVTCDDFGAPRLAWYDTSTFENEGWSDGGSFGGELTPYEDGDVADGGWFMGGGDSLDGGALTGGAGHVHLSAITSLTVSTDDVVITGVEVTAADEQTADGTIGEDGESATYGTAGYVLKIADNPLVCYGQAQAVAQQIGPSIVGMRFRPLKASGIASPAWQAGDALVVTDQRSRTFRSWITTMTYKAGGYANVKCDAATPARNSAESAAIRTLSVVEGRKLVRAEKTAREVAVRRFAELVATSSGLYMTSEPQPDGSTIYYAHDKKTLAESTIVWKFTANAFAVSTDGGETYPYGLDATGNAILQRIYTIGLDADYITAGEIRDRQGYNFWDLVTGDYQFAATGTIGGRKVSKLLQDVDATITDVDVQYAQNQSSTTAPSSGWSTTAPTWREGYYIWQRTATTNASGTTYSTPTCISGREGHDGTSVSILGSYDTLAQLEAAHPTGNAGDAYMVAGDLYVWNGSEWEDVGKIQGPQGEPGTPGAPGSSVTVSKIEYGLSSSASTQPSSWSQTVPTSITKGQWLWCKTTYSDSKTAITKTYVGTDGDPAYAYSVNATPTALVRTEGGTLSPSSITFSATRAQGTGTPAAYAGRFKIDEYDGTSWASKYTSSSNESSKSYSPTSTAKVVRCTLYLAGGTSTVLDIQSVPIAQDGATGGTGASGADAYTVLLTNESHTFAADMSAAIAGNTTSSVVAFKGASRVAATIGSITGAPTGMSVTTYSNGSTSAYFKVTVTTSLTARSGTLTVPVTVDGKSFSLVFSWSLALKGDPGVKGDQGVGASAIVEQYYLSTSSTTQTGGSWSTTQPAWSSGKYIWTRSKITWTDDTTTYTDPVLAKAINGANETSSAASSTATAAQTAANAASAKADALDLILNGANKQAEIFNRLTNNGAIEGLFMHDGQLYVNASYLQTGLITDSSGLVYWDLDTGTQSTSCVLPVLISEDSINVSGSQSPHGSKTCGIVAGQSYVITFTSASVLPGSLRVFLSSGGSGTGSYQAHPTLLGTVGGAYRYAAVVRTSVTMTAAYVRFTWWWTTSYSTDAGFTVTNVRVYKQPDTGNGTIAVSAQPSDGSDAMSAMLLGGLIRVMHGPGYSELTPGRLMLNGDWETGNGSEIVLGSSGGVRYNESTHELLIAADGFDGAEGTQKGIRIVDGEIVLGYNLSTKCAGPLAITSATGHFEPSSGITVSLFRLELWGNMATLRITFKNNNAIALNSQGVPTSSWSVGNLVGNRRPSAPYVMATGACGSYGSATFRTVNSSTQQTLYLTHVAQYGSSPSNSVPANTTFLLYATYFIV